MHDVQTEHVEQCRAEHVWTCKSNTRGRVQREGEEAVHLSLAVLAPGIAFNHMPGAQP